MLTCLLLICMVSFEFISLILHGQEKQIFRDKIKENNSLKYSYNKKFPHLV